MKSALLSSQQLDEFRRDGFVIIPRMYSAVEIAQVSQWVDELVARQPKLGEEMVYYEDSILKPGTKILSRIEKFADYHEGLRSFIRSERMSRCAEEFLGEPALLFKEKINFKMPGGAGFAPHQDIQPGWDAYADYFISVLVTIDKSTVANGCLELSAGHHRRGLIGRKWKPLEGDELKGVEFTKYPMEPGDVAFFDCFVPHQSQPNLTGKPRRNLYLTFSRRSQGDHRLQYFEDKRKSYPPDNEREAGKEYKFRV